MGREIMQKFLLEDGNGKVNGGILQQEPLLTFTADSWQVCAEDAPEFTETGAEVSLHRAAHG